MQVCVEKCPTVNFAFVTGRSDWKSKMICKVGVTPLSESDAETKINENKCAGYYLQSKEGESNMLLISVYSVCFSLI
jgi:hypothetical protein